LVHRDDARREGTEPAPSASRSIASSVPPANAPRGRRSASRKRASSPR
jgi:hypothetical protein